MHLLVKKNAERTFRPSLWYSRNSSVWLMYHTPATDGRWCRLARGILSPCIRAYKLTRYLTTCVDVMTRCGNQTPSEHFAYCGGTRAAIAMHIRVSLISQVQNQRSALP